MKPNLTDGDRTATADVCPLAGRPDLMGTYLEGGFSAEEVIESLLALDAPGERARVVSH